MVDAPKAQDSAPRNLDALLTPIDAFLQCPTPEAWLQEAVKPENRPILLIDHCNCELKAAQTGLQLMRRYALADDDKSVVAEWTKPYEDFVYFKKGNGIFPDKKAVLSVPLTACEGQPLAAEIIRKMVALIKEELLHFEQVLEILQKSDITYDAISASRYAKGLIKMVRTFEPATLVDKLIIGAYIEARSCERFARLAPRLPPELAGFYYRLLKSEARHFSDYLTLANKVAQTDDRVASGFEARVQEIGAEEATLISSPDDCFRFHSGVPETLCA
ncbi:tRNA isopentenyl-2-thiomethyl-A-37 hydroxylase MiaE [Halioxenophilus sp. WMMB6]|uniref:tRNA isopentenyl-2-thiomethyl-A-37 hydroxylase MiaE n=1 Tax=Halioxenophilus sp. WMMB6 TaxID=3073815 RepID=UPI00295EEA17|nr:tRNA isopentenyl-2-thiomethyl-A-37 hydroxylase MiaE [Halioxenophilus sp. WMMB6]